VDGRRGLARPFAARGAQRMSYAAEPRVAIIGGGLAGMAAAAALVQQGCRVELFEARRQLGGRAASFDDPATGDQIDYCQHVSMGCCTQLEQFCRTTGVAELFREDDTLHFLSAGGSRVDLRATFGLPAPLHLLPALLRLDFLSFADRVQAGRLLMRLALWEQDEPHEEPTIAAWLKSEGASPELTRRFFGTVLVSALGERLEAASVSAARQVFVDGFMRSAAAWKLRVPRVPLAEIFDRRAARWLEERGVAIHRSTPVKQVLWQEGHRRGVVTSAGETIDCDACIIAVPWRRFAALLPADLRARWPESALPERLEASPITGVHLWFDRTITTLPHAVLVDRLSQWMFQHGATAASTRSLVQVVISASHELAGRPKAEVVQEVVDDLDAVFPDARGARLLESRVVTEPAAVFSVRPGSSSLRLPQRTPFPGLFLAGDWTATGWPATMEGAVRSGYLAAAEVLSSWGMPSAPLAKELPSSWLARMILPSAQNERRLG